MTNSESLILFETAPAATFLHRRSLHCSSNYHPCTGGHFPAEAATIPAPATIFLHQQIPADTSSAPAATSPAPATFLQQRLPNLLHQLLILHQRPPSCLVRCQSLISKKFAGTGIFIWPPQQFCLHIQILNLQFQMMTHSDWKISF